VSQARHDNVGKVRPTEMWEEVRMSHMQDRQIGLLTILAPPVSHQW
jgi:hypothetical protein